MKKLKKQALVQATELFLKARATDRLIHDVEKGTLLVRLITNHPSWRLTGDTPKRKLYNIICSLINGNSI